MSAVPAFELPIVLPRRRNGLHVVELADGTVVLDAAAQEVHLVVDATAIVFDACDGVTTSTAIITDFVDVVGLTTEAAVALVGEGLEQLALQGLLEGTEAPTPPPCIGCGKEAPRRRAVRGRRRRAVDVVGEYELLGVGVRVEAVASMAAVLRSSLADLPPAVEPTAHRLRVCADRAGRFDVELDDEVVAPDVDASLALAQVLISLNQLAAAAAGQQHALLHAGTIELDGAGVVLAGHSGAGKSTLVAGAVLRGAGFVADEMTAVDDHGVAHRYHRPIGLRRDGAAALGVSIPPDGPFEHTFPFRAGGVAPLVASVPVAAIFIVQFRPGPPSLVRLGAAGALHEVTARALAADGRQLEMFGRLQALVERVPVFALASDDVDVALALIRDGLAILRENRG